jgi:hypothetical protein
VGGVVKLGHLLLFLLVHGDAGGEDQLDGKRVKEASEERMSVTMGGSFRADRRSGWESVR